MADITVIAAKVAAVNPQFAEIYDGIAGVTITAGQVLYRIASSGKLGLADEDASAEASRPVGIALNGGGAGQAISYLRYGRVSGFTLSGNYGSAAYLSTTAGALADSGTIIYGVVEAMSDSSATKVLHFDADGITAVS